ncbi:HAD family hydrolase [Candidatus Caldatribacterium sp.]|uniref:HAD family hydrolase n=1 Tax=Candidatus Caldatribacterium sp. TaxID=2282143 RepID=UPI0029960410|nr:HAD family hydrolase [Candidatus Caldatribacterium sp.]MDW8081386.1 HAD family hydrolase [Candidatus Calescibacterium sp.]
MFKLFIWDLDNTVIGSSKLLWGAFQWVAERFAQRLMSPQEIVSLYGPPEDVVVEQIVGRERKEEALRAFYEFYEREHDHLVTLFPEVLEIIAFLRTKKVKQALFTAKGRKSASITLDRLRIGGHFDFILCGDEVERAKPYPDGVIRILRHFGVQPSETLYVGDSPLDAQAAHGAGVAFALALWDSFHRSQAKYIEAEYVFATPREMFQWMQEAYGGKTHGAF